MKQSFSDHIFQMIANIVLIGFTLFCFFPFWFMISGSLTEETELILKGYSLIPGKFSFAAYSILFESQSLLRAYEVSMTITLVGTLLALVVSAMLAYSLSNKRNVFRSQFLAFVYIPMLFTGGLVPFYITVTRWLHLRDSLWAMILPSLCQPFLIFLLVNFFRTIPEELEDAARIDGANEFRLFFQIIIPISKPILATVGLFYSLTYWNDWFNALMFIDDDKYYPLQLILRRMVSNLEAAKNLIPSAAAVSVNVPTLGIRMSTTIVTIGPIILLYPFLQKYFVKGLTIGAIKG